MVFCVESCEMAMWVVILLLTFVVCFLVFWFLPFERIRDLFWRIWPICSRPPRTASSIPVQEDEKAGKQTYPVESRET